MDSMANTVSSSVVNTGNKPSETLNKTVKNYTPKVPYMCVIA
ncbi:M-factor precursor Mfm3 [Schizosaccharomyces pombe]|uniref:M-factor n=1 Tax=Schizosaccharomyces pombe (strain 972 / ATCC 24843) TaxID=284812 RepID=MFM3_SCHPO|nr:M-factor precursor Mfm3 [Schizosaccharomyces pombe]P40849.1 RecName: Full=M-factor; Flags: Precursor [Schizosaccharomyces pombe 972h-]AAB30833.1 M-factor mating pheromone [Schizosaccharomyces pombe]BAA20362.1 Mfm3 [Schizosaccharomyces pombe]CAC38348.1 M-factor precursor Mfm3 [Schizosaccharomyces pombe]|eukprot:NP_595278.1 M-factor precursor Mfm3 [Schizosaccharomyces pombe]